MVLLVKNLGLLYQRHMQSCQSYIVNFFQLKMSYNLSLFFGWGVGGASVKFQWWIQDFKKGGGGDIK